MYIILIYITTSEKFLQYLMHIRNYPRIFWNTYNKALFKIEFSNSKYLDHECNHGKILLENKCFSCM